MRAGAARDNGRRGSGPKPTVPALAIRMTCPKHGSAEIPSSPGALIEACCYRARVVKAVPQGLTERERLAVQFIKAHVRSHGYPPSLHDIAAAIGLRNRSSAHWVIKNLVAKGYLTRNPGQPRTLTLTEEVAND